MRLTENRPGPSAGEWPEASGGPFVQILAWRIGGCMHGGAAYCFGHLVQLYELPYSAYKNFRDVWPRYSIFI